MATELSPTALAALKAEIEADPAARGYAGNTAADQAALLNAPYQVTGSAPAPSPVDVAASAIEQVVVPTGELFAINQLAAKPVSGSSPPSAQDQAIAMAWSFARMLDRWTTIQTSTPAIWSAAQDVMSGLLAADVLSAPSIAAITALVVPTPIAPVTDLHPRVMEIFLGIEDAPNAVTADDVTAAGAA